MGEVKYIVAPQYNTSTNSTDDYYERYANNPFGWTYIDRKEAISSFRFEEADLYYWHTIVGNNPLWAGYAAAIYLVTIFGIKILMRNRAPFQLKWTLFSWNFLLGIFSIMGFVRTLPGFVTVLSMENGLYHSICSKVGTDIPTGFWTCMFILSKFVELGDTVFIVLRKRPLVLLQWYHHVITMSSVWVLGPMVEPICRWYMVLNYGVHSLMYPYFAFKTIGFRIPTYCANLITSLQLLQMIVGFTVNITSYIHKRFGEGCARTENSIQVFVWVYGSFIFLFGHLFYKSVVRCERIKKERAHAKKAPVKKTK